MPLYAEAIGPSENGKKHMARNQNHFLHSFSFPKRLPYHFDNWSKEPYCVDEQNNKMYYAKDFIFKKKANEQA